MTIKGLGIDIVEVERIEAMVDEWGEIFLEKVFSQEELDYCTGRARKLEHLAGRFAAKEAIFKAVGRKLPWQAIEILPDGKGKPVVTVEGLGDEQGGKMLVSITHVEEYAMAIALLSG